MNIRELREGFISREIDLDYYYENLIENISIKNKINHSKYTKCGSLWFLELNFL